MAIIVCDDVGRPLQVPPSISSAEKAAAIDRSADLLMAYQLGCEAKNAPEQMRIFSTQFGEDAEAHQHFEMGTKSTPSASVWHHPKEQIIDDPFERNE